MQSILSFLWKMLPFTTAAIPVILLCRFVSCRRLKGRGLQTTVCHELGVLLLFVFLTGLASQTILPDLDFAGGAIRLAGGSNGKGFNLIPFKIVADTWVELTEYGNVQYLLISLLGNVGVFLPLGFFLPLLWRRFSFGHTVLAVALCSFSIEFIQLFEQRSTDIDDLICNTLGGILGWLLYRLFRRLAPVFSEAFRVKSTTDRRDFTSY